MRKPGPEPETAPSPGANKRAVNAQPAGDGDDPDNDPLIEPLERWEQRFFNNDDDSLETLGIEDPVLLEALRERIAARKHLYAFLGLSEDPCNAMADDGDEMSGDGRPATRNAGPRSDDGDLAGSRAPNEPRTIGRYHVRRALGQGGYGRVYLAHDSDLDRLVAIKVPIAEKISPFMDIEGYLREARTLARLSHPHIVPVHDVGHTDDGLCYIVSRYMEGGDLAARLKESRYTSYEAAGLVACLAEALHYAHIQDLVHRDIKPANILLDADGEPSLADFGLALKEENQGRGAGFVGTVAYMSPEQARGEGHLVDGRSDIFSLAIVFYELLAGRRPFWGKTRLELLQKIIGNEPRPPRQINDTIPRELERICLKALSKRAAERYSTAKDLAEDLRHALANRAETARTEFAPYSPLPQSPRTAADRLAADSNSPLLASSGSHARSLKVVPKGLSSFDEQDADFFLDLLPGPRDRHGLPDCLRFWKSRIEATDPDKTFRVGIIYGPSGCGKSSLVKAGLLPLLDQQGRATPVYVEATGTDTEARLLRAIRKASTGLKEQGGLVSTMTAIRRDGGLPSGGKLLLVIDQLEQWLFGRQGEQGAELIDALRQCDGENLQALCLVRDDFWMATTRFMKDLEIDILSDRNISAVDLFEPKHARRVLAAYGRAYGSITEADGNLSREQSSFLDQAVAGLAQDGTVVPVRLALFAEMVKGKPWTPTTLRDVGGTDGVGVKFLEETFSSARASPAHRYHQVAAQTVLKALLPEPNADIKGRMRSVDALRAASGYGDRAADFSELIRVLDNDLRLITPVDSETAVDGPKPATALVASRNYQLTHDYLVHSLRDWLTRKQQATRRGRAQLLLAERAAVWNNQPEGRYLPSMTEWTNIRLLTRRQDWTEPERRMLRRTDRLMAIKTAAAAVVVAGLYLGALAINDRVIEVRNEVQAYGLVQQLVKADTPQVPAIVREMRHLRRWTDPALVRILEESAPGTRAKLHASISLLPAREDQIAYLHDCLEAADPATTAVLIDALRSRQGRLVETLWKDLRSAGPSDHLILPTASMLSDFDPTNPAWRNVGNTVASAAVDAKISDVEGWLKALWNVRAALAGPLAEIYRDQARPEVDHTVAATFLARYVADQPTLAVDLLVDADPDTFSILFPVVKDNGIQAIDALGKVLSTMQVDLADQHPDHDLADRPGAEARVDGIDKAWDQLAARRARAAVALLELGHADQVWHLLEFNPEPTPRSTLINTFHTYQAPSAVLIQELVRLVKATQYDRQPKKAQTGENAYLFDRDLSKKRGLIQALAAYPSHELSGGDQATLVATLIDVFHNDADAGVHSAAELLLRRWGRECTGSAAGKGSPGARWFVNKAGQTMVRVEGPIEFQMGSAPDDKERETGDIFRRRKIPRAFAISTKEVTIREFEAFTRDTGRASPPYRESFSPHPDGPQVKLSWYDAAAYCNWLSVKEGKKPCYLPIEPAEITRGVRVNADAVAAGAYRLPTEAEWEYACLAGTTTCRYCGRTPALLKHYEWYVANSDDRARPCGSLLPNEFGMFDMLGNVIEWCHDGYNDPQLFFEPVFDDAILPEIVAGGNRLFRGLSFLDGLPHLRAGTRGWLPPSEPRNDKGFRPARTCTPTER
jgi:eukaryotic-like serine/threonine-protein kinase